MKTPPRPVVWAARLILVWLAVHGMASFYHNLNRVSWTEAYGVAFLSLVMAGAGGMLVSTLLLLALGIPLPWRDQ